VVDKEMSLQPVLVTDSRLVVGDAAFRITDSGLIVQPTEIPADQSGPYTSNLIFSNILPPNTQRTAVSTPRIRYTITATALAGQIVLPTQLSQLSAGTVENVNCVLRAFPLTSVTTNANLQLNSQVLTSQPRYQLSHLQRYIKKEAKRYATFPAMSDDLTYLQKQSNSVSVTVANAPLPQTVTGTAQQVSASPLCQYVDSEGRSRASYVFQKVTAGGDDTYTITIEEPVMLSPFAGLDIKGKYLYNVNNMSINYSFGSFADMFYNQSGNAFSSITVSDARLEVVYITVGREITIPPAVTYDYNQYTVFTQSLGSLSTASTQIAQSQALKFSSLPKRIFLAVRPKIDNRTSAASVTQANAADACLSLLGVNGEQDVGVLQVNIQNKTLFANATPKELYLESCINGYDSSMTDFLMGSGSYLCISPRNMGFDPSVDLVVGESGQISFQAQMRVSFFNYAKTLGANLPANVDCEMVVIIEQAGAVTLAENATTMMSLGPVSDAQVKAIFAAGSAIPEGALPEDVAGGGLFGDIKSVLHKGLKLGAAALATEGGRSVLKKLAGM
jgi:hypothetical protein